MGKHIAIIAVASSPGEAGGAERFYQGLCNALCDAGVDADIVYVAHDESNFDSILKAYLHYYDLDLSAYDGIISTKAPGYLVRHPNHVCYLQHTMRVFYDLFDVEFPSAHQTVFQQRKRIHDLDTAALSSNNVKRIFVIGEEVKYRLLKYNNLKSDVLYQATTLTKYRRGMFKHLFLPGRLHRWKRVHLAIDAMKYVHSPLILYISGTGEEENALRERAKDNEKITFLGKISDGALLDYYSNALAVPFIPFMEDFGLVTLEAFHSGKPVITCSDSGEPARMVRRFNAGLVCKPEPKQIANAIDALFNAPNMAYELGANGRRNALEIRWDRTAATLIDALEL